MLFQIVSLGTLLLPVALFIVILMYIIRVVRRVENRAEERLKLDKESSALQQQQMKAINELNVRLTNIETVLKEIE
ncbi:hypothetical protein [Bacillus norwichensis]|uniref:DUF4083 domain-containing protein n=1 Tax=Bacillus norwichensis TaxID=2762217 RepID=A0ABR8VMF5_9BACI|nr:hypothetical protein [Bacillus norwichensis]MBD8005935.1 hypothetical protein [Bacillus norwichensis]